MRPLGRVLGLQEDRTFRRFNLALRLKGRRTLTLLLQPEC